MNAPSAKAANPLPSPHFLLLPLLATVGAEDEPAAFMVMLKAAPGLVPPALAAVTVKLLVPAAVGVPLITPVLAARLKPTGRLPTVIAQLVGLLDAARVWL